MVEAPLYSAEIDALPGQQAGAGRQTGFDLSIPNLITLGRILLVPIVVWAIATPGAMWIAFVLFLAAGVSDAVDGYLAKRFAMTTELGAYLDPLADKALIVSIYLTLGINNLIPRWLVILVVSRDILIVGGIILSWLVGKPLKIKPLLGLQTQHGGADRVRQRGARLARLQLRAADSHAHPHGPGRRLDLAVGGRLCRRMGAPHERDRERTVSPRARSRRNSVAPQGDGMPSDRQVMFWLAALAAIVLLLWLLSQILLPFVAGAAIAYLLTPVTDRLQKLGVNRLVAALLMITLVVMAIVIVILLIAPILVGQMSSFIDNHPRLRDAAAIAAERSEPALGAQAAGRELQRRQIDGRSGVARARLAQHLCAVALVGRPLAGLAVLAGGGDAGGRVLPDLRLAPHDSLGRQLGAGQSARNRAPARARNRRRHFRLRARADRGLPDPRLVLRGRAHASAGSISAC